MNIMHEIGDCMINAKRQSCECHYNEQIYLCMIYNSNSLGLTLHWRSRRLYSDVLLKTGLCLRMYMFHYRNGHQQCYPHITIGIYGLDMLDTLYLVMIVSVYWTENLLKSVSISAPAECHHLQ